MRFQVTFQVLHENAFILGCFGRRREGGFAALFPRHPDGEGQAAPPEVPEEEDGHQHAGHQERQGEYQHPFHCIHLFTMLVIFIVAPAALDGVLLNN